jgi:hypothetical protein
MLLFNILLAVVMIEVVECGKQLNQGNRLVFLLRGC